MQSIMSAYGFGTAVVFVASLLNLSGGFDTDWGEGPTATNSGQLVAVEWVSTHTAPLLECPDEIVKLESKYKVLITHPDGSVTYEDQWAALDSHTLKWEDGSTQTTHQGDLAVPYGSGTANGQIYDYWVVRMRKYLSGGQIEQSHVYEIRRDRGTNAITVVRL